MKFFKKLLFVIVALIALVLITALFVKKEYSVTRTVVIQAEVSDVYDYISYLENQKEYAIWQAKDPQTKNTSVGVDGTVGFIQSWSSKHDEVGVGEQEITKMKLNKRIDFALRFEKPMKMEADAYMTTELKGGGTEVTWGFEGGNPWPFNIVFLFLDMDKELGPDLQEGLDNLKKIIESKE